MRFLWPELLWLMLLLPMLLAAYAYALRRRKKEAIAYPNLALVREAIGPGQKLRRHVPPALFFLATAAALLAAARPTAEVTLPAQYMTIALAMDVSRSMLAGDVAPNRISAAQAAARAFITDLPKDVRLGIVSFAGTAFVVQTPTDNREELTAAIDRFSLQRGTATGSGLMLALATLFPDDGIDLEQAIYNNRWGGGRTNGPSSLDQTRKEKAEKKPFKPVAPGSFTSGGIILLTDGRRTTGPDPLEAAKMAADRGVRVYTVGFGTPGGGVIPGMEGWSFWATIDEKTLKQVAGITGGEYFAASTGADLSKIYETLSARFAMERKETEISGLLSALAALLLIAAGALSLAWNHRRGPELRPRAEAAA